MSLEVTKAHRAFGGEFGCCLCKAERRRYTRPATKQLWVIGYPLMRVCRPHEKAAREMYEGAIG